MEDMAVLALCFRIVREVRKLSSYHAAKRRHEYCNAGSSLAGNNPMITLQGEGLTLRLGGANSRAADTIGVQTIYLPQPATS
ncbi:MAG: hypothetical protein BZY82_08125 [SAR202 cluster bacterium Io17-Chloro-G3]|nr:MAG: hypothetical protein BZY82_08125 [SAR202 cluster bacterium Io17-Chloro-G3]